MTWAGAVMKIVIVRAVTLKVATVPVVVWRPGGVPWRAVQAGAAAGPGAVLRSRTRARGGRAPAAGRRAPGAAGGLPAWRLLAGCFRPDAHRSARDGARGRGVRGVQPGVPADRPAWRRLAGNLRRCRRRRWRAPGSCPRCGRRGPG